MKIAASNHVLNLGYSKLDVTRISWAVSWLAALLIAFVFLSNEQYKLLANPGAVQLFTTLAKWIGIPGHEKAYRLFTAACEITASLLLLFPRSRIFGAVFSFAIMTVALISLMASPLTTDPYHDGGKLFLTTWVVWFASWIVIAIHRKQLMQLLRSR